MSRPKTLSYTTNIHLFHRIFYINCLENSTDDTPYMTEIFALEYFQYSLEHLKYVFLRCVDDSTSSIFLG